MAWACCDIKRDVLKITTFNLVLRAFVSCEDNVESHGKDKLIETKAAQKAKEKAEKEKAEKEAKEAAEEVALHGLGPN